MKEREYIICPRCGKKIRAYRNPLLTVDIIIQLDRHKILLIERQNPPLGWALPGGFVDYGESLESAARREAEEETSLDIFDLEQFRAYSDPGRDPRHHTVTMVFSANAIGEPQAGDDAKNVGIFDMGYLPNTMAFDHREILRDFARDKKL